MKKAIPRLAWLKSVNRWMQENDGGHVVRAQKDEVDEDGNLLDYQESSPSQVNNEPGIYVLLDSEDREVSRCFVADEKDRRQRLPSSSTPSFDKTASAAMMAINDSWGNLATFQRETLEQKERALASLREENDSLKIQLMEATIEKAEPENEWIELIKEGLEVFKSKSDSGRFLQASALILQKSIEAQIITAEQARAIAELAQKEIIPALGP